MSRLRYNNAGGVIGAGGMAVGAVAMNFGAVPPFATLVAPDYIPLILDPPSGAAPNSAFEVVNLTAYTSGQQTGTITATVNSHAAGANWACGPVAADFTTDKPSVANSFAGLTQGQETTRTIIAPGQAAILYKITVDQPCRVRLYATQAQATADLSRTQGTDPTGNHGCLLEVVFIAAGTLNLSPEVLIVDQDTSPSSTFYANIRCDSGTTLNVTFAGFSLVP